MSLLKVMFVLAACSCFVSCSEDSGEDSKASSTGGSAGSAGSGGSGVTEGKLCLLSDIANSFDDRSFTATAVRGINTVKDQYQWRTLNRGPVTADADGFKGSFNSMVTNDNCDLIVAISSIYGGVTAEVAAQHPTQKIQAIDYFLDPELGNVWGQTYKISEATFLAGYVAASVTKTGKVGTFGGLNIPPVVEFMEGYALGIQYYNKTHSTSVEVIGWDVDGQTGFFIDDFSDVSKGQSAAEQLMEQGADIVFPVAGAAGFGAADAAIVKGSTYVIGVDTDWATLEEEYRKIILTSALKNVDVSIITATQSVMAGTFAGKNRLGTLESGEVDIAPFHDLESVVPASVKAELPDIRAKIVSGELKTRVAP